MNPPNAAGVNTGQLTGAEDNSVIAEHLPLLVALRQQSSMRMGLSKPGDPIGHAIPKVGIVVAPRNYRTTAGDTVGADQYDVSVRMLSMLAPHPATGPPDGSRSPNCSSRHRHWSPPKPDGLCAVARNPHSTHTGTCSNPVYVQFSGGAR